MVRRLPTLGFCVLAAVMLALLVLFWVSAGPRVASNPVSFCNERVGQRTFMDWGPPGPRYPADGMARPTLTVDAVTQVATCHWPGSDDGPATALRYQLHHPIVTAIWLAISGLCLVMIVGGTWAIRSPERF
jgi:hypothetical protein